MTASSPPPEAAPREELVRRQTDRLRALLAEIVPRNRFWTGVFESAGVDAAEVRTLDDLSRLPLCTKAQLVRDQAEAPPYGTNLTYDPGRYSRLHQTSGTTGRPLRWLDTPASWNWFLECWAQIFRLVGVRSPESSEWPPSPLARPTDPRLQTPDSFCFAFSFGPFIGFWAAFEGAQRMGNLCLAAGGMSSEARLQMILDNQATIVCCTPTYARRLAEVAAETGIDLASASPRALIVAGEAGGSIPATRSRLERAWGARVFDHWGMTELGALAVECAENPGGLHVLETECIAEVLDPDTHAPVSPGEPGELVVTNLGRWGSPLIRYRTGDLVVADTSACPCGRALLRLQGGVLGRVDEMVTIRGNNVFPTSIEAILREFAGVGEYRVTVSTRRAMPHLKIEIEPNAQASSTQRAQVAKAIKDRLNFQAEVIEVAAGTLPRFEMKGRRFVREE